MKKTDYLKWVRWSEEDDCYIGSIPDLCGDCCHGDSQLEVFEQLLEIHDEWIAVFNADSKPLPDLRTRPMMEPA
jgi:predicted RNase H-like HicB family nuclease